MAVNLNAVHEFAMTPNSPFRTLVKENHYLRFTGPEQGDVLFIQHGQVHAESGPPYAPEEIPDWLEAEIMKCHPQALRAVGWAGPFPEEPVPQGRRRR